MIYLNSAIFALLAAPLITFALAYYLSKKREIPNHKILSKTPHRMKVGFVTPLEIVSKDSIHNPNVFKKVEDTLEFDALKQRKSFEETMNDFVNNTPAPFEKLADNWLKSGEDWMNQYNLNDKK